MPLKTICKGKFCPFKKNCVRYLNHKDKEFIGLYQEFYKLLNWGEDHCKFFIKKN